MNGRTHIFANGRGMRSWRILEENLSDRNTAWPTAYVSPVTVIAMPYTACYV